VVSSWLHLHLRSGRAWLYVCRPTPGGAARACLPPLHGCRHVTPSRVFNAIWLLSLLCVVLRRHAAPCFGSTSPTCSLASTTSSRVALGSFKSVPTRAQCWWVMSWVASAQFDVCCYFWSLWVGRCLAALIFSLVSCSWERSFFSVCMCVSM
jgi:hypothetical protein